MSTNILRGQPQPTPKQTQTTPAAAPKTEAKNELAKPEQKGVNKDGRYQNSYAAEGQINRSTSKTYKTGDTSDLFTPNAKPSKLGGAVGTLGGLLPNITKEGSFEKSITGHKAAGSFSTAGGLVSGQGSVTVGELSAKGQWQVGISGGALKASAQAEANATLLHAQGSFHMGKGAYTLDARGEVHVGAKAKAAGEAIIDPAKGIFAAKVAGEAFVGLRAGGEANVKLGQFGSVGARAEALVGVGASFKAELGVKDGRFKARVELGASLGIGFKIGFNIDIDLKGIKDTVKKVLKAPVEAVKNVAKKVGNFFKKLKFW